MKGNLVGKLKFTKERGITLIALAVTIIVLLILAGVSIMTLTGDNGLLTRTVGAKNKTKLAEAQEIANLEYMNGRIGDYVNGTITEATISNIINAFEGKFETTYTSSQGDTIIGAMIKDGENSVTSLIILNTQQTKILKASATKTQVTGNKTYYVKIDNLWHKINFGINGIEIEKNGIVSVDEENVDTEKMEITVEGIDSSTTVKVGNETFIGAGTHSIQVNVKNNIGELIDTEIEIKTGNSALTGVTITARVLKGNIQLGTIAEVELKVKKPLIPTATRENPNGTKFSTDYGKIDVIWLDGTTNTPTIIPNDPTSKLGGMTKVTWTEKTDVSTNQKYWDEDATAQTTWYNYAESKWANAKNTEDGSYFVWIPRYAYRITYFASKEDADSDNSEEKETGFYDGYGMWKKDDGNIKFYLDEGIETVTYNGKSYIVHPAFMKDTGKKAKDGTTSLPDYERGGWNDNLTGIWVAKYEMSMEKSTDNGLNWSPVIPNNATETTGKIAGNVATVATGENRIRAVSKPCTSTTVSSGTVSSWRYISAVNSYSNSYRYKRNLESHLIKNSEWGAVAYLAHSQYGTNGEKVYKNNSNNYFTGNAGDSADASSIDGITNFYNSTNGVKASSTGNIYGIYDLVGGASEFISASNSKEDNDNKRLTNNGGNIFTVSTDSTKYNSGSVGAARGFYIYYIGKIGDASKEVSTYGTSTADLYSGTVGWYGANLSFTSDVWPFGIKAGKYGLFGLGNNGGTPEYYVSFRVALAP